MLTVAFDSCSKNWLKNQNLNHNCNFKQICITQKCTVQTPVVTAKIIRRFLTRKLPTVKQTLPHQRWKSNLLWSNNNKPSTKLHRTFLTVQVDSCSVNTPKSKSPKLRRSACKILSAVLHLSRYSTVLWYTEVSELILKPKIFIKYD